METEREAVVLAVPFTAGVAVATFLLQTFYIRNHSSVAVVLMSFAATVSSAVLIFRSCRVRFRKLPLPAARIFIGLMFLSAGMTVCLMDSLTFPDTGKHSPVSSFAYGCREALSRRIMDIGYSEKEHGALVCAFLTGDRSGLDGNTRKIFRDSGASHLLALSGMHLGIIYMLLSRMLAIFGNSPSVRKTRSAVIISGAGFFTLMTGASPSIVRAFLFILLREGAAILGRKQNNANLLCIALTVQLTVTPGVITSAGFQLSYLAMTGIFTLYPVIRDWWNIPVRWLDEKYFRSNGQTSDDSARPRGIMYRIWDMSSLSIACQVFTAPVVWLRFGTFPQYFILTNLLCIPLMNLVMISSVAVIALSSAGLCPAFLLSINDSLLGILVFILSTISGMQADTL